MLLFFLPRCPQASTGLCRGRAARVRASRMFGLLTARLQEHRHHVHLTISLTQSRQLDRPAHGIGEGERGDKHIFNVFPIYGIQPAGEPEEDGV